MWWLNLLTTSPLTFASLTSSEGTLGELADKLFDPSMTVADLDWLRSFWRGPLIIKGIQTVDDALRVVDAGADAIVLSNHGGRQLDRAPIPLRLVPDVVDAVLASLAQFGLVAPNADATEWRRPPPASAQAVQLSLLAQATIQTIERYYLAVALLLQAGSGQITQSALAERCQLLGQRMTMLYGINSPEFFDRTMFENFLDLLRARGVIRIAEGGKLAFDDVLAQVAQDAQLVLQEQMRHSILQIAHS